MGRPHYRNIDKQKRKPDPKIIRWLKATSPRGFEGQSLYSVGRYFLRSLFRENLNIRAYALSYNFFLALFPMMMVAFSLIAYVPRLKTQALRELSYILPKSTHKSVVGTINDILNNQHSGLLSFGIILAVFFASNGFHSLILNFNRRLHDPGKYNWIKIRGRALLLTTLFVSLLLSGTVLLYWINRFEWWLVKQHILTRSSILNVGKVVEALVLTGMVFTTISMIYFFGPIKHSRWRFVTAGSVLATILSVISTIIFTLYVNSFNSYNKIYGSIGAIIVLLIIIYVNTLSLIVGFELNSSIDKARVKHKLLE